MKIPIQPPPDFSSLVPPDVASQGEPPPPTSDGMSIDNLSPEQANSIPDEGKAEVGFKKTHHRSEKNIHPDGSSTEKHSVRLAMTHFHPKKEESEENGEEEPVKKKAKIGKSAHQAVADHFSGGE